VTYLFIVAFGSEGSSSLLATGASLSDMVVVAVTGGDLIIKFFPVR